MHTLGTFILVYLFIGSALWVVLDGLGGMSRAYFARIAAGKRPSPIDMLLAIILAIIAWPVVARKLLQHPRRAASMLAKIMWGRP
jgi:hypothetical protein